MKRRTHSITPETDDFGARYDRMVAGGPGPWALKIVVALIAALAAIGLLGFLLMP